MYLSLPDGRSFAWDKLPAPSDSDSEFVRLSLDFCRDFRAGKTEFIFKTSGSTGRPKDISVSRRQIEASATGTLSALNLGNSDRFLVCLHTGYTAGKMMLARALICGAEIVLREPSENPFSEPAEVNFAALVPLQMQNVVQNSLPNLPAGMKSILLGGAPVSFGLQAEIERRINFPVFHSFGMTETLSHFALRQVNGPEKSESYRLLTGFKIGRETDGRLKVSGEVTNHKELITNDLIELISPDSFIWKGRADEVINSAGLKIFIPEAERLIAEIFTQIGIDSDFIYAGFPDEKWGEKTILFTEKQLSESQISAVKTNFSGRAERYLCPKEFVFFGSFPMTETGKIRRKEIQAVYRNRPASGL